MSVQRCFVIPHNMLSLMLMVIILTITVSPVSGIECLACSYTFTGPEGLYDRECVSDVHNFTKTMTVQCPNDYCSITAVYASGYTRLNSLSRGCDPAETTHCDDPSAIIARCQYRCSQPNCNDIGGDLRQMISPNPDGGGNGGNNEGRRAYPEVWTMLMIIILRAYMC